MKAAVVSEFGAPPRYTDIAAPVAAADELVVEVLAAGLHPRVRSQADGSHYTSTGALPLVPGIDGVGRTAEGRLRYFVLPDTQLGAMAERTVIDARRSIELPDGSDPVAIAAAMNPAMSAWIALRRRIDFARGQRVLVLGASGSAGQLAVQIAAHLGAGEVIAAGRDPARLAELARRGVRTVSLAEPGALASAADVDVVLDYVWGEPTAAALAAIVTARADRSRPLTWIEIGSVAGATAAIPSAALRAARLQLVGSGQGSVSTRDIVGELPALADYIIGGGLAIATVAMPLSEVTRAWTSSRSQRIVLVP